MEKIIGFVHNGNYLGILELLSKYDSFLDRHIEKYGNKGSGCTSYLSHDICEEIIQQVMADNVLNKILEEVRELKYFSISVDSTPDLLYLYQITL